MRMRMVKGLTAVLCAAMLAPVGAAAVLPGLEMVAEATNTGTGGENTDNPGGNNNSSVTGNPEELLQKAKDGAENQLKDYQLYIDPDKKETARLDDIISKAVDQIKNMSTAEGVERYITRTEKEMDDVMNPPNDDDDDEDDDPAPVSADHLLMVGGNWVTPVANAGQAVSIVLPVVNMGKTMVTDAVVTPVLSTDTTSWPFEITSSNYSQTIKDLPGTDTGMSDMDRRREVTWDLKTRSDVGNGYQKISFKIVYRDSEGNSQETTLDTYVQLSGTAGVGADGKASVPRVVVTGFETEPKDVHAGESFMLTLHLKNTSTATSVNNMIFESWLQWRERMRTLHTPHFFPRPDPVRFSWIPLVRTEPEISRSRWRRKQI